MIDPTKTNSVIFDFSGTLCFGRYFEPLGQESLDAIGTLVFGDSSARWGDPWMKGDLTSQDIASYLGARGQVLLYLTATGVVAREPISERVSVSRRFCLRK